MPTAYENDALLVFGNSVIEIAELLLVAVYRNHTSSNVVKFESMLKLCMFGNLNCVLKNTLKQIILCTLNVQMFVVTRLKLCGVKYFYLLVVDKHAKD